MAGDLMTPYAHFAAKPLPCSVPLAAVLFGKAHPIPASARAEIAKDMKDLAAKKPIGISIDKYIACLSKTEWRSSKHLSEALGISSQAVTNYMRTKRMKALTTKRMRGGGSRHYIVWRLK